MKSKKENKIDSQTYTALKAALEFDSIDKLLLNLDTFTKSFSEVVQSMFDSNLKFKENEVFIETLSVRIIMSSRSIMNLTKGIYFKTIDKKAEVNLVDTPSINIITRATLETFLTLEYLFYNDLNEDEQLFRFNI